MLGRAALVAPLFSATYGGLMLDGEEFKMEGRALYSLF